MNGGQPGFKPLAWYRSLHDSRNRKDANCFLIEGPRAVGFIQSRRPDLVVELLIPHDFPEDSGFPHRRLSSSQLRSVALSQHPQWPIAVIAIPPHTFEPCLPENPGNPVLLLEDVQDPGNVGTLIRTAAALRFAGVILSEKSADPFSPKAVQASAGSIISNWIRRTPDYLEVVGKLKAGGYTLIGTDMDGSVKTRAGTARRILALGNEGSGLSPRLRALSDELMAIPIDRNRAESLNVAQAGAIGMYLMLHDNS